jgi:hypothetical protein
VSRLSAKGLRSVIPVPSTRRAPRGPLVFSFSTSIIGSSPSSTRAPRPSLRPCAWPRTCRAFFDPAATTGQRRCPLPTLDRGCLPPRVKLGPGRTNPTRSALSVRSSNFGVGRLADSETAIFFGQAQVMEHARGLSSARGPGERYHETASAAASILLPSYLC